MTLGIHSMVLKIKIHTGTHSNCCGKPMGCSTGLDTSRVTQATVNLRLFCWMNEEIFCSSFLHKQQDGAHESSMQEAAGCTRPRLSYYMRRCLH
jgi:hypothetical protein